MTASAVLAVALDVRRALETLSADQREEALLLVLDEEPLAPEDVTRAQLAEVAPEVAAGFPTSLPLDEPPSKPEAPRPAPLRTVLARARPDQLAQAEARVLEVAQQLVANAGGRAQTSWIQQQLNLAQATASKHIRRAIQAGYFVSPKLGIVEINPAPDAPVVVADRSRERKRVLGTAKTHITEVSVSRLEDLLQRHGPQTERGLAARTGAALVTVRAQLAELRAQGRALVGKGAWSAAKAVTRG